MMIRKFAVMFLVVGISISSSSICIANGAVADDELREPEPAQLEQEINDLSRVREEFISLKKAGKIASIKPDETGWSGDVAKVTPRYVRLSKDFNAEQFKQELSTCNNLYRAELAHPASNRRIMGFLCLTSGKINLLSIYELKDKTWVKNIR